MKLIAPTAATSETTNRMIKSTMALLVVACLVSACGSDSESGSNGNSLDTLNTPLLTGTVSTARGVAELTVEFKSPDGIVSQTAIDEFGRFTYTNATIGDQFLMRADLGNGNYLYSIAHLTDSTENRQNIHSYTDLVARTWFADLGLNINSVFDSAAGIDNFPTNNAIDVIDSNVQAVVSDVLDVYGLSDVSLSNDSFDATDTGVDRFLNENPVIIRGNRATIIVNDPQTNLQATAVDRVQLTTSFGVVDVTPPEQPQNVRALGSRTSTDATEEDAIILAWSTASDNIGVATYDVFRDGALLAHTPFPVYRDSDVEPQTSYLYTVTTVDESGNRSTPSLESTGTTLTSTDTTPPAIPSSATLVGNTDSVDVFWDHSDFSDLARFEVTRTSSDGILVREVTSDRLSDITVASGTEYCYTIVAVDASGNRSDTNQFACITTSGADVSAPINSVTTPATIEMAQSSISGPENTVITAFVNRSGNASGEISINYSITPGTATAEEDYAAADGTLVWADGDLVAKQIDVSLIPDGIAEDPETFTIVLTDSSSDAVIANAVTTVTIVDIDQ